MNQISSPMPIEDITTNNSENTTLTHTNTSRNTTPEQETLTHKTNTTRSDYEIHKPLRYQIE